MGPTRRFAPSAPGTVLTRNRNDSKDNLMNSSLRLQVTEGPVPQSAFNGGPLSLTEVPNYLSVSVGNEIVGYTPAVGEIDPTPSEEQTTAFVPVYNASLQTIVGHLVSGEGFVPSPGSGLPSTFPSGVNSSTPFVVHTR
jgi:hypothetical protein